MKSSQSEINALREQAEMLEAKYTTVAKRYDRVSRQRDSLLKSLAVVDQNYLATPDIRVSIVKQNLLERMMHSTSLSQRNPHESPTPGKGPEERGDKKKKDSTPAPEPKPRDDRNEDDTPSVAPKRPRG